MARIVSKITIKFPWWTKLYIGALVRLAKIGIEINLDHAGQFIADNARYGVE